MIHRSYDPIVFRRCTEGHRDFIPEDFDFEGWLAGPNVMYSSGDSIGLATLEYPGVYNVHWFFTVRGRDALDLAFEMLDDLFNTVGAEIVRGITKVELRGARYLAKKVGFTSLGVLEFHDGPNELMFLSKEAFNDALKLRQERNG